MIKKQQKAVVLYLKETNAWNDKNLMNQDFDLMRVKDGKFIYVLTTGRKEGRHRKKTIFQDSKEYDVTMEEHKCF